MGAEGMPYQVVALVAAAAHTVRGLRRCAACSTGLQTAAAWLATLQ